MKKALLALIFIATCSAGAENLVCTATCYKTRTDDRNIVLKADRLPAVITLKIRHGKGDGAIRDDFYDACVRDYGGNAVASNVTKVSRAVDGGGHVLVDKFEKKIEISKKADCKPDVIEKAQERHETFHPKFSESTQTAPGG